jgi:hypothetical protein
MDISEREFKSLDKVRDFLSDEADGVATFQMWQLRDALGYSRLGPIVTSEISQELDRRGVGHLPDELGLGQYEKVRLYLRSSSVGKWLDTASKPGYDMDVKLREAFSNSSLEILDAIRKLVK